MRNEQTDNYDSHVWDYRRTDISTRCQHDIDGRCSWCTGTPDPKVDGDIIGYKGAPNTTSRVHPQVAGHEPTLPQYTMRYRWSRSSGATGTVEVPSRIPDTAPIPVTHEPNHVEPWRRYVLNPDEVLSYDLVVLDADDPQEIRVREAVRDFGLLTRHRDLKYATGIGLDYDAFVWGIVAPEPDHLSVEGAGLPIRKLSTRPTRPHDRKLDSVRAWRASRGVGA